MKKWLAIGLVILVGGASGCGSASAGDSSEPGEQAPPAARKSCERFDSEAKEIGCLRELGYG